MTAGTSSSCTSRAEPSDEATTRRRRSARLGRRKGGDVRGNHLAVTDCAGGRTDDGVRAAIPTAPRGRLEHRPRGQRFSAATGFPSPNPGADPTTQLDYSVSAER